MIRSRSSDRGSNLLGDGAAGDGQVRVVAGGLLSGQKNKQLIEDELALLERLRTSSTVIRRRRRTIARSPRGGASTALFLLVVVGEFNAGKSAFINALVGAEVMPEGVTPTTSVINLLRTDPSRETMQAEASSFAPTPPTFWTTSRSSIRRARTPSSASTSSSPSNSCRAPTWFSSSPRPTARSPRASGSSWSHPRLGQEDRRHHQQGRFAA